MNSQPLQPIQRNANETKFRRRVGLVSSGGGERELSVRLIPHQVIGLKSSVSAIVIACSGALAQGVADDGFDGPRAPAAFGAATEAIINLLRVTQNIVSGTDGVAYIGVAKDVAGTNDH
jgi:hypothetical protein